MLHILGGESFLTAVFVILGKDLLAAAIQVSLWISHHLIRDGEVQVVFVVVVVFYC